MVICKRIVFRIHARKFFFKLSKTTFLAFAEGALPVDDASVPRGMDCPEDDFLKEAKH
jgi:hypothetical protein